MGIFRRAEKRSAEISISNPVLADYFGIGNRSFAGVQVSESGALTLSAVFRAVSVIAGAIAALPMRTLREDSDGMRERVKSFLDEPGGPEGLTAFEWRELIMWHLCLHGDAFLVHGFNGAGALASLTPLHPRSVSAEWDSAVPGGKKFTVTVDDGTTRDFDSSNLTHLMGPSLDGLRGMSVIGMARNGFGTAIAGDRAAARMFANGALISGMVTTEENISEDEAKELKAGLTAKVQGYENAGDIAFVNRNLRFTPWTMNAADAQFLESREFSISEIGRWFGVPANLLMKDNAVSTWGTGVEVVNRGLRQYTLISWTTRIEQRLSRLLGSTRFVEFDYSGYLKPSPEQEIGLLIDQVNSGLLTLNEARRIRNMPPLADPSADLPRTPPGALPPEAAVEPSSVQGAPDVQPQ